MASNKDFKVKSGLQLGTSINAVNGTAPLNGQLLIGNTTSGTFDVSTLTAGANITITNAAGGITIASSGGSSSLTATQIGFGSAGNLLSGSADFTFNSTTKTLNLNGSATIIGGTIGEDLTIKGGRGYGSSVNGGHLKLVGGGADTAGGGDVQILTGNTPTLRMSFGYMGGLALGTDRLNFGTAGQCLLSGGASAPTWGSPILASGSTLTAAVFAGGYTEQTNVADTSTAYTIDLSNGSVQVLTLTGNATLTFPAPVAGKGLTILLKQDATGSRSVSWPASVKWPSITAPTITTTASKLDKFVFISDGTYWYGSTAGQNY